MTVAASAEGGPPCCAVASQGPAVAAVARYRPGPAGSKKLCGTSGNVTGELRRDRAHETTTTQQASALNQVLGRLLPRLADSDQILIMDADSQLSAGWLQAAVLALARNPLAGAVCGVFLGERGGGLVGQLQRNEYVRYARQVSRRFQVPVLSGTGTMFRVSTLRQVAAGRGHRLPGIAGEVYNVRSITEDDEITLAIKTLGLRCLAVYGCETTTEVMPGWTALWTQRLRWQAGALSDLRRYGFTAVTSLYWLRQTVIYVALLASMTCWVVMLTAFSAHPGFNLGWTIGILGVNFAERAWTARRAGWAGVALSMLMLPEFIYDTWRMAVYLRAIFAELTGRELQWGHLTRTASA